MLEELGAITTNHFRRVIIGDNLARQSDPRPGIVLNSNGLPDLEWCEVSAGSIEFDGLRLSIDRFCIGKYPITWAQYETFVQAPDGFGDDANWSGFRPTEPGQQRNRSGNHPAENVSWFDALAFCRWLSRRLDQIVGLPFEWEWQLAATGGSDARLYPWGPAWDPRLANTEESTLRRTTAVGMYPAGESPVGALDMSGNVWEWCVNSHDEPRRTGSGTRSPRAVRGGSWHWDRESAYSMLRSMDMPDIRVPDHGFRIVAREWR